MPKYISNFNLEVWCKHLEIEADSLEEAAQKLYHMTTEEIVNQGVMNGVYEIKDLEVREAHEDDN